MGAPSEQARYVRSFSAAFASQLTDFMLRETAPRFGGGMFASNKSGAYDLVKKMSYLYVRVMNARELPGFAGSINPYVELCLSNFKGMTQHFEKNHHPEWNEFSKHEVERGAK